MEVGEHTELSLLRRYRPDTVARVERAIAYWQERSATVNATVDERAKVLREAEDKANEFVMQGDALLEAVVYKLLYARGLRIGNIEAEIRRALDRKVGGR